MHISRLANCPSGLMLWTGPSEWSSYPGESLLVSLSSRSPTVYLCYSLYILGLYEENTTNYMPYLFSADYSSIVYRSMLQLIINYSVPFPYPSNFLVFLAVLLTIINLSGIILFSLACVVWYQMRGITGQNHWPSIIPPTLFNFILILIWFVDRAVFYAGLLGLAGITLFLSGYLLRPIWYHPSPNRVRETIVHLLSPWRSKDPFLTFRESFPSQITLPTIHNWWIQSQHSRPCCQLLRIWLFHFQ